MPDTTDDHPGNDHERWANMNSEEVKLPEGAIGDFGPIEEIAVTDLEAYEELYADLAAHYAPTPEEWAWLVDQMMLAHLSASDGLAEICEDSDDDWLSLPSTDFFVGGIAGEWNFLRLFDEEDWLWAREFGQALDSLTRHDVSFDHITDEIMNILWEIRDKDPAKVRGLAQQIFDSLPPVLNDLTHFELQLWISTLDLSALQMCARIEDGHHPDPDGRWNDLKP